MPLMRGTSCWSRGSTSAPHAPLLSTRRHSNRCDALRRQLILGGAALTTSGVVGTRRSLSAPEPVSSSSRLESQLERRVSRFQLPNGMVFLVVTRPEAPIVSVNTYCSAGAWVEENGQTGTAHLLEHLAFKGTARIGTRDWTRERGALRELDQVFYDLRSARSEGRSQLATSLQERLEVLQESAQQLVVPNAFAQALISAGAVGLNASTSHDCTRYYASLPSNQLELWFALEADRFQAPVFRELYREKQVVEEERALRVDNSPAGRLFYEFATRSLSNNYRRPVLGYAEDLEATGRMEVAAFFEKYYHPRNMTVAVAGAADPDQVYGLAEKYFGGWREVPGGVAALAAPSPNSLDREPSARPVAGAAEVPAASAAGSRERAVFANGTPSSSSSSSSHGGPSRPPSLDYASSSRAGPVALLGYYRPSLLAPGSRRSGVALEVACDILTAGRTGRLARLAQDGRLLAAGASPDYPAELHPGLALVTAVPRPGDSPQRSCSLVQSELDRLALSGPTPAELSRVKKAARTELLGALQSNAGLASTLVTYEAVCGSWRGVLEELAVVEGLTAGDVSDVAASTFDPSNCITALIAGERSA